MGRSHTCHPAILPSCLLFRVFLDCRLLSQLPSPHQNLFTQLSSTGHPQFFQFHGPRGVSKSQLNFCPVWLLTALKFMVTLLLSAQSPSQPSALPFAREFTFCPELKTWTKKTNIKWRCFRHEPLNRDSFFKSYEVRLSPHAGCALACALCCLHSWELLAPLAFDSLGSYKMPYFLAVSLFKNKNGFTRPWPSCCLSLVTPSFPGASASGSPSAWPSAPHSRLCSPTAGSAHPYCKAHAAFQPSSQIFFQIQLLCLHPSNLVGPPLCIYHLGFCRGHMAGFPVPLLSCFSALPTQGQGIFQKHKPDLALCCSSFFSAFPLLLEYNPNFLLRRIWEPPNLVPNFFPLCLISFCLL